MILKIVGMFHNKELQKTNQKEFEVEKVIKRKFNHLYAYEKDTTVLLIVGLIKKILLQKSELFYTLHQNLLKRMI